MQRLTGLDSAFLALETPRSTGHVGGLSILDPSSAPEPLDLARLTDIIGERLSLVPSGFPLRPAGGPVMGPGPRSGRTPSRRYARRRLARGRNQA